MKNISTFKIDQTVLFVLHYLHLKTTNSYIQSNDDTMIYN